MPGINVLYGECPVGKRVHDVRNAKPRIVSVLLSCVLMGFTLGQGCPQQSTADSDGDGIADVQDNCPQVANPDQADANYNGSGDACETASVNAQSAFDRDLDGFADAIDPSPDNSNQPANLGSPELILANPLVVQALTEVRARGLTFQPETASPDPTFDLSGTYSWGTAGTDFPMTSDRTSEGVTAAPGSWTYTQKSMGLYRSSKGQPNTSSGETDFSGVTYLRGSADQFTFYDIGKTTCSTGGPRYDVSIESGKVDPATGDLIDLVKLSLVVAIESHPVCNAPGGDDPGGWQVVTHTRETKKQ